MLKDDLTLITSDTLGQFHGGPYMLICEKTTDERTKAVTIEGELKFNTITVRRFMGTELMFPILLLHAINDHQRELHGYTPPERKPLQI